MARMTIKGLDEYASKLSQYSNNFSETAERAVKAGASPVADEIRRSISNLSEDKFRRLQEGDKFSGAPLPQKKDLLDSMGITPASVNRNGDTNVKIGFSGYGSHKTKKYKSGLPNALLARAIESGSSVRKKTPFVRQAVARTKSRSIEEITKVIETDLKIYAL